MTNEPDNATPTLELQDIANIVQLVNIAIERGGYERTELRVALDLTDKVSAFLVHTANMQEAVAKEQAKHAAEKEQQAEQGET
jgi:hypothetical protein